MESAFQQLRGEQLSSITFVRDSLQLDFDGPGFSIFTPVSVHAGRATSHSGDEEFRNALCGQIAKIVADVICSSGEALTIRFEDGSQIAASLKPEDYTGPEAFVAHGFGDSIIVHRADD
jgi:hypothetical protein